MPDGPRICISAIRNGYQSGTNCHRLGPSTPTEPAVLPIELMSIPGRDFKDELLRRRKAWIIVEYANGRRSEPTLWHGTRLTPRSNILRNLRSRSEFRRSQWQKRGIIRIRVTLIRPAER